MHMALSWREFQASHFWASRLLEVPDLASGRLLQSINTADFENICSRPLLILQPPTLKRCSSVTADFICVAGLDCSLEI